MTFAIKGGLLTTGTVTQPWSATRRGHIKMCCLCLRRLKILWDNCSILKSQVSGCYLSLNIILSRIMLHSATTDYYGYDGPLTVGTHLPAIFSKWAEAGIELGYPVADPNAQQIPSL